MTESLKKFGKYFLLDLIAQGGMAEVYRARMNAADGGGRLVAIKRILSSYSKNVEFVNMFRGEIKTTSGFTHPNIVQIYDYGDEQGQLYLAMEIVEGKNLRQILSRAFELKRALPPEIVCFIIEQAAHALSYAHQYRDKMTNQSLDIVHRDVSPQNILVSYDGAVKVIDFGIAKATTNMEATRSGMIKGKPSYLSPEQILGTKLDGRSDLFSLGSVFWEALTGKKLFVGENEYSVIRQIENCGSHVKPPSHTHAKIPKELDEIVLKCLQKNPSLRYESAAELQKTLHLFLSHQYPDFNPVDLSFFTRDLFKIEILEDYKKLQSLNDQAQRLIQIHTTPPVPTDNTELFSRKIPEVPSLNSKNSIPKVPQSEESGAREMVFKPEEEDSKVDLSRPKTDFTRSQSHSSLKRVPGKTTGSIPKIDPLAPTPASWPRFAIPALVLFFAGFYVYNNFFNSTVQRKTASQTEVKKSALTILANVKYATVQVNDKSSSVEMPFTASNLEPNKPVKIVISSNGYRKFMQEYNLSEGEDKVVQVVLLREEGGTVEEQVPSKPTSIGTKGSFGEALSSPDTSPDRQVASKKFTLLLEIQPASVSAQAHVFIDGERVDSTRKKMDLQLDVPYEIFVENEGYRSFRKSFSVSSSELNSSGEYKLQVALESSKYGYLNLNTTPSSQVTFKINGQEEVLFTPIVRKKMPVGQHELLLVNKLLKMEKKITVKIQEDRFTSLEEPLSVKE